MNSFSFFATGLCRTHPGILIPCLLSAMSGNLPAQAYRVFDWQGKSAPTMPVGTGSVTLTNYVNGGQCRGPGGFVTMDISLEVSVSLWNPPSRWQVDPEGYLSGGNQATYGYQSPDEAEFNFGNPGGTMVMRFDVQFSQPVNNPSFFLMDVDNNGSDHGTLFEGTILGGGTVYPHLSLKPGTTVAWTGAGSTLDIFSNGGPSADNQASGAAFFAWLQNNVTSLSFVWESSTGANVRMSNIYAEYTPAGFGFAVPEPSSALLILIAGLGLSRRRR